MPPRARKKRAVAIMRDDSIDSDALPEHVRMIAPPPSPPSPPSPPKRTGWFRWSKVIVADLGEENSLEYNTELRKWVSKQKQQADVNVVRKKTICWTRPLLTSLFCLIIGFTATVTWMVALPPDEPINLMGT